MADDKKLLNGNINHKSSNGIISANGCAANKNAINIDNNKNFITNGNANKCHSNGIVEGKTGTTISNGFNNNIISHHHEQQLTGVHKSNGINHEQDQQKSQKFNEEPPDGGLRGWTVMISAFLCNGIIFGVINTSGVIYAHLQTQLENNNDKAASTKASLAGALTIGTTFLLSPVAGMLTDKIGLRMTTFIGGLFCTAGMFLSSFFAHDIVALCFTYGIMFGLGAALAYTPTLAILGHYFKRYLGKVSGFVTAGSSIFTIILPPVLKNLLENCGLNITFQTLAAISAFIMLCSTVYKPLHPSPEPPKRKPGRSKLNFFFRSIVNVDIWKKKRYVIWALCIPLALFGYFVPYVHMVKFVKKRFIGDRDDLPVMCIGISSGIGRLIFGILADLPGVNRIFLQQISLSAIGILTMCLTTTSSYITLNIIVLAMGLFDGCFISLLGPIAYEICGPQGATQAIGFLLGLSSLTLTAGPPIAGLILDSNLPNPYTIAFILAGIPPILGASLMFLIKCVKDSNVDDDKVIENKENDVENEIITSCVPLTNSTIHEESKTMGSIRNGNCHFAVQNGKNAESTDIV